jgi:hypothetical protein
MTAFNGKYKKYKTSLCSTVSNGEFCLYGVRCQFAHDEHELRPLWRHAKYGQSPCKHQGVCPYGDHCQFRHTPTPNATGYVNPTTDAYADGYVPTTGYGYGYGYVPTTGYGYGYGYVPTTGYTTFVVEAAESFSIHPHHCKVGCCSSNN